MTKIIPRILACWAFDNLTNPGRPMVFISGARQVGKTVLAGQLNADYYNWDTSEVRRAFAKDPYFFRTQAQTIVFDEIHKRRDWKRILKGYYDSPTRRENFVVTGSGRMDQYQRSGDSLQGRYDAYHLWPLAFDEIKAGSNRLLQPAEPRDWPQWEPTEPVHPKEDDALIRLGGFPAPFLDGRETKLRRWQDQYLDRLLREDARDYSQVQRLDQLDLLARILPERVGSPLSVLSLSRDIEASPVAVRSWLRLMETLYLGFMVRPFHRKVHRAVKKEPKWYFQQWTFVEEKGARFENYLAVQLAAACSAWREQGYGRYELYYLRDQDRREVDFLIARDMNPVALFEAKNELHPFSTPLNYYCRKFKVPGYMVSSSGRIRREPGLGWSVPASVLLSGLVVK